MSFASNLRRSLLVSAPIWIGCLGHAQAACTPAAPVNGQTVTCTGANQPAFIAPAGVTGLTVNVTQGSSVTGVSPMGGAGNQQRNSIRVNDGSTINNDGTISPTFAANQQRDYVGANLNGSNTTLVNNGAIILNNPATLAGSANFRLYGVITSDDAGAPAFANVHVVNNGSISLTQAGTALARGIYAGENIDSMTVDNFGTVSVTRTVAATTVAGAIDSDDDVDSLTVNNHAGALLTATGVNTDTVQGRAGDYTVNNDGTITNTNGRSAIFIWRGGDDDSAMATLSNTATGVINGDVYLVDRNPLTNNVGGFARDSDFDNAGAVNGSIFYGKGAHTLDNSGTISGNITVDQAGTSAFSTAAVVGDMSFDLTNSGGIGGNITIAQGAADSEASIENGGTIGGNITIAAGTGAGDSDIDNAGTIAGNINIGQAADGTADVDNSGTIGGSVAITQGGAGSDASIDNSGSIAGNVSIGAGTGATTAEIDNSGSIAGNLTVGQAAGSTADIENSGSIGGSVIITQAVGGATSTLTNSGSIGGNITIADKVGSQNTVTLVTGSTVGGNITAQGLGNNQLVLTTGGAGTPTPPGGGGGGDDDDDDAPAAPAAAAPSGTVTSNVSGFTSLTQTDGDWTLAAGTTQTFSASATIQSGTLTVDSTLTAPTVTVENPATLAGTGTIVGNITSAGTLSPGNASNPYGTLNVTGSYTQQANGTFQANIAADGSSNRLAVNGTAALDGTLNVTAADGRYSPYTRYTIISTTGGLSGDFSDVNVTGLPTLIGAMASNDGQNETVTLTQKSFRTIARTPNQRAVAGGLDAALAGRTDALTVLDNQSNAANATLLDRVSGQGYTSFADPQLQAGRAFTDAMMGRAYNGASTGGLPTFESFYAADLKAVPVPVLAPRAYNVWATGYGQFAKTDRQGQFQSREDTVAGFAGGIDFQPAPGTVFGLSAGYSRVAFDLDQTLEHGRTDNGQVGAYAGIGRGPLYLNASVGYAHAEGDLNRGLGIPQLQPGGANGSVSGDQFLSAGEAGYKFDFGPDGRFIPFVGYQVGTFDQDAVRERGGGLFNLNVRAQDFLSARGLAGGRFESTFAFAGYEMSAGIRAAFVHEFADTSRTISESFVLAPANPFTINGIKLEANRALVGVGVGVKIANGLSGFVRYDNESSASDTIQAVFGGLRYTF